MATMSEEEKIQVRSMNLFWSALAGPVHMMTVTQNSAVRHHRFFASLGGGLGVKVAQLPLDGPESARSAAYQAQVVVGPIREFIKDFNRGSYPKGAVAMIEGEPPADAHGMLSRCRDVMFT